MLKKLFLASVVFTVLGFAAEAPWELSGSVTNFPFDQGMLGIEVNRDLLYFNQSTVSAGLALRNGLDSSFTFGAEARWLFQPAAFLVTGPTVEVGQVISNKNPEYAFARTGLKMAWASEEWSMFWEPSILLSNHHLENGSFQALPFRFGIAARF